MKLQTPNYLTERAAEEFVRVGLLLEKTISELDLSVLAEYAQAHADVIELTAIVRLEGDTLVSDKGNAYVNPRASLLMTRRKDLERLRRDLGLTPTARKITPDSAGAKVSALQSIRDRKKK